MGKPKIRIKKFEKSKAVVCLFGWLGAQMKYLEKYSSIYHDLKSSTVLTIPQGYSKKKDVSFFLKQLQEDFPTETIFFHTFSGNGFWMYCQVMQILNESDKFKRVKARISGTIHDSGPPDFDVKHVTKAMVGMIKSMITKKPKINKSFYSHMILTPLLTFIFWILFLFGYGGKYNKLKNGISKWENDGHKLFLYSKGDPMCSKREIMDYKNHLKSKRKGIALYEKDFKTSLHVSHFRDHPKAYKLEITDFINMVINLNDLKKEHS